MSDLIAVPSEGRLVAQSFRQGSAKPADTDRINPHLIWSFLRRRFGVFVAVLGICLAIGAIVTSLQVPTYTSTAQVTLKTGVLPVGPLTQEDQLSLPKSPTETFVDTQVEEIASEQNLLAVATRLGLDKQPRFASGVSAAGAMEEAIDYLRDGLSVLRPGATYTIDIQFEAEDAKEAAKIANAFAWQYSDGGLEQRRQRAEGNLEDIGKRMEQARVAALTDSVNLQKYRISNNLLSTSTSSLTEQEISTYNQQVTDARATLAESVARLETARAQLRRGSSGEDLGEALDSPVISGLRQKQTEIESLVASLESRYGPEHPDLKQARGQLASVNQQIKAEIGRIVSNLTAKVQVARQRLDSLQQSLGGSTVELRQQNNAMVGLQDLEQKSRASTELYESYLARFKTLSARVGTEQTESYILHPAIVSGRPSSPNIPLNMLLAGALGLAFGFAAALVTELSFTGLTTGDEIEQRLQLAYLGSIPDLKSLTPRITDSGPADAVVSHPRSQLAESLRNLRTSIAFNVAHPQIVALTSALPAEGKSSLSLALSRSMAMEGDRILLIDTDFRKRGVSHWLAERVSLEGRPSLIDVLEGDAPLANAVVIDEETGLAILPISGSKEGHGLLTGEQFDALLAEARKTYHAIILDTAPILAIADGRLIMNKADAAVLVIRWRKTPVSAIKSLLRLLPDQHVRIAGAVLSRVDIRKQAKYGYSESTFYKSYNNYYA